MNGETTAITGMLPFLIPLIVLEFGLLIFAFVDIIRREYVSGGNKGLWIVVVIVFGIFGPLAYFIFGRKERPLDSD